MERPADDTADTDMAWDRYLEHLHAEQQRVEHKLAPRAARSTTGLAAEASAGGGPVGRTKCVRAALLFAIPPPSAASRARPPASRRPVKASSSSLHRMACASR